MNGVPLGPCVCVSNCVHKYPFGLQPSRCDLCLVSPSPSPSIASTRVTPPHQYVTAPVPQPTQQGRTTEGLLPCTPRPKPTSKKQQQKKTNAYPRSVLKALSAPRRSRVVVGWGGEVRKGRCKKILSPPSPSPPPHHLLPSHHHYPATPPTLSLGPFPISVCD